MKQLVKAYLGEAPRCREVWRVYTNKVRCAAFSPDGARVLAGFEDHTVQEICLVLGLPERTLAEHAKTVTSLAFLPDGKKLLTGGEDWKVRLWETRNSAMHLGKTVGGQLGAVFGVACSPDGKRFLSCGLDETIMEWSLPEGGRLQELTGHTANVFSVAYAPDGRRAVSASADKTIKMWSLEDGCCLKTMKGHKRPVHSVAYSPDGQTILSGGWDSAVKLWDAERGICLKTLKGHTGLVYSVAFAPNGKYGLSGGDDNTVKLWDLESGSCLLTLPGHSHYVWVVAFSPDMRQILSGGNDGLRLWKIISPILSRELGHAGQGRKSVTEWPKEDQGVLAAALWQCWISGCRSGPYVIKKMASLDHFRSSKEPEALDVLLNRDADRMEKSLGEALRDLVVRNKNTVPVVVSSKRLPRVLVVSDAELEKARNNGPGDRWDNFYTCYPGAIGELEVSQPGISADGLCAIIYLGRQAAENTGFGRLWVFRKQRGRWRLTAEEMGPRWIS